MKTAYLFLFILLLSAFFGCAQNPREQMVFIPTCRYYAEVGTYTGDAEEIAIDKAYEILKERNENISKDSLELDTSPYNIDPSKESHDTSYPLYGEGRSITVDASQVVVVRLGVAAISSIDATCKSRNDNTLDDNCISDLHFIDGKIYIEVANPC